MIPLEASGLKDARKKLLVFAKGDVLELGTATGVNLPFYEMAQVNRLILSDTDDVATLKKRLSHRTKTMPQNVLDYMQADAQNIPFKNDTFDTVVSTLIFCSVPDVDKGLAEIRRILKPGGSFIFLEHVISSNPTLAAVMHGITPAWKRMAHGCHLDRNFENALRNNGFSLSKTLSFGKDIFYGGVAKAAESSQTFKNTP